VRNKHQHLFDEELLLFIDRELPSRRAIKVRDHLTECQLCRERRIRLEKTLADFDSIHDEEVYLERSIPSNSRSMLKARIAELSSQRHGPRAVLSFVGSMSRQLVSACVALPIVAGGAWAVRDALLQRRQSGNSSQSVEQLASSLPRRQLTPGATRAIQIKALCGSQDLENDPAVDPSMELAVFREYGLPPASKAAYELDYLITPALGGTDDIRNLWPQPYSSTWNAGVKDQLENHLRDLVCEGKVQLTVAQNEIATDWIAAYKRYFNTDKPLPDHATTAMRDASDPSHGKQRDPWYSTIYGLASVMPPPTPFRPTFRERLLYGEVF
jgi:hypothetical protein